MGDAYVHILAVGLLVVYGIVLERGAYAVGLDALDKGCCHLAGEQGVFGVVLKVAPAQRVAVQVHARGKDQVEPVLVCLVADGLAHLLHQLCVPCTCQGGADGESCVIIAAAFALAQRVDTQSGRAVGEHGGRDAKSWDGCCGARGTGYDLLGVAVAGELLVAGTYDQHDFLFGGHLTQNGVDIVGLERGSSLARGQYQCQTRCQDPALVI